MTITAGRARRCCLGRRLSRWCKGPSGRRHRKDGLGYHFHQPIEVAHPQQAESWELRATMSLYRVLQAQGRGEQARRQLAEVYGWFTEGFGTPDLQEARDLLNH